MNKNQKQFKGIPPSVIFTPSNYRSYMNSAKNLYLLNLHDLEHIIKMDKPKHYQLRRLHDDIVSFHLLCVDLTNQDCQHGFYRPDPLDIRYLVGWMYVSGEMCKKLSEKLRALSEVES